MTRFRAAWLEGQRVDVTTLRRTDVVGIGHVLSELDALIARLRDPSRAAAMGVDPPRGILFHGEPGLGKTLCARYVAASLGPEVPFYEVSADQLSPDRIRGALRYLSSTHPRSVLYLDEIDTFGMARDYSGHDPDTRQLLTATLAALDGLVATSGPVVIASSNRSPHFLDQALVRSGRIGYRVRFDAPDEDERVELFGLFTRTIPTDEGIDYRRAARLTRGRSPADLRQIVDDAAGLALAAERNRVAPEDMLEALRRLGDIEPQPVLDSRARRRLAIHEGGHVAVAVALRGASWLYAVRIGQNGGTTEFGDEDVEAPFRPDDENRDALAVAFGGISAERALLGEATLLGRSDVSKLTDLALDRIIAGVTDEPAPLDLSLLDPNVAESLKEARAGAIVVPILAARALASAIVARNTTSIDTFAKTLEAAGELTGDELREALAEARFVRLEAVDISTEVSRDGSPS